MVSSGQQCRQPVIDGDMTECKSICDAHDECGAVEFKEIMWEQSCHFYSVEMLGAEKNDNRLSTCYTRNRKGPLPVTTAMFGANKSVLQVRAKPCKPGSGML